MKFTFKVYIKEKDNPEAKSKLHVSGKIESSSIANAKKDAKSKVNIPYGFEISKVGAVLIKNKKEE